MQKIYEKISFLITNFHNLHKEDKDKDRGRGGGICISERKIKGLIAKCRSKWEMKWLPGREATHDGALTIASHIHSLHTNGAEDQRGKGRGNPGTEKGICRGWHSRDHCWLSQLGFARSSPALFISLASQSSSVPSCHHILRSEKWANWKYFGPQFATLAFWSTAWSYEKTLSESSCTKKVIGNKLESSAGHS